MIHTPSTDMAGSFYADGPSDLNRAPVLSPEAAAHEALAESMFPKANPVPKINDTPYNVRQLRNQEEDSLYDRTSGYEMVPFEAAMQDLDIPETVKVANATEYRHIAADLDATPAQAETFLDIVKAYAKAPLSVADSNAMQTKARTAVREAYGKEADSMLALAQRLVQRDPRLAQIMRSTDAGNDPRVVLEVIELAKAQRARGRLK